MVHSRRSVKELDKLFGRLHVFSIFLEKFIRIRPFRKRRGLFRKDLRKLVGKMLPLGRKGWGKIGTRVLEYSSPLFHFPQKTKRPNVTRRIWVRGTGEEEKVLNSNYSSDDGKVVNYKNYRFIPFMYTQGNVQIIRGH